MLDEQQDDFDETEDADEAGTDIVEDDVQEDDPEAIPADEDDLPDDTDPT